MGTVRGSSREVPSSERHELAAPYGPLKVSVIVPVLNEADNLPHVLPKIPEWVHEILLVDGHSVDGSQEVARRLSPEIRIIAEEKKGKGAALRRGFNSARGDILVAIDADGSMDPEEIPAFVDCLIAGGDFAKGSRFLAGGGTVDMPLYRKAGNRAFVILVRLLFKRPYTDLCYGYNAFWARTLPRLNLSGNGFEIETIMNIRAARAGLNVVEVPSFEDKRKYGKSRLRTIPDGWRVLKAILGEYRANRRERPHARIVGTASSLIASEVMHPVVDVSRATSE